MLRIYNSLSGEKEPLPDQKKINMFVCGPTAYDYLHIGNARTYMFFDFFAKYLRSQGYEVDYLQNITDIDDKIIKRAVEEGKEPEAVAAFFTKAYLEDMEALGVNAVTKYASATKFITQIIAQIERLIDKSFAYKIDDDGWYFDIAKDKDYGKLSHRTTEQAEDGTSRIDESVGKRNKGDFCLWKFSKPGEPSWPGLDLGEGRPGWHIEDTAISEFYFGPQYEIHGGGVDLKFPHHEAEIAQQESASGLKPFVRTWMHVGALLVGGKKMSKSLGNFITIRDFLKKYPPEVLRYFMLGTHYRSPLNFTEEGLKGAKTTLDKFYSRYNELAKLITTNNSSYSHEGEEIWKNFNEAIANDFNTPQALAILHETLADSGISDTEKFALIMDFNKILGLLPTYKASEIPEDIKEKQLRYDQFRSSKQFIQSDALRKEIEALGYSVRDTESGSHIVKKFF